MDVSISGYDAIHYSIATIVTLAAIVYDVVRKNRS
jgi:hypothetical protein